jgi:predicted ATPase
LSDALRDALYIGPLRAVPSRAVLLDRGGVSSSRWADGLAAWEALVRGDPYVIDKTNEWLLRLRVGCKIVVQKLFDEQASADDIASGHVDVCARRLLVDSGAGALVLPSELGAGVSQVVPVVAASVLPHHRGLVMIEQPEIHVHPALQVELGDLFIESAADRQFLIETHSEHLILRLLRRIRETTQKELSEGSPALTADRLSVLYVERDSEGVRIRRLRVDESGEFTDRWPKGFFDERYPEIYGA